MIIYREDVERMPNQDRRKAPKTDNQILKAMNPAKQNAFASGNLFESMAKSNPELFDRTKIKQLQASKNLVEDFAKYFDWIYNNQVGKAEQFLVKHPEIQSGDQDAVNLYTATFNTAFVSGLVNDLNVLITEHGMSEEDAKKAVFQYWIPESVSEAGIRKILDARVKNNRILTDALTKMIKMNYRVFQLTEAEAASLIEDLNTDEKNHEAIGKIKEFLENPKTLEKFKNGNNYDFRSIGGAVLFLSDDDSIQFSQHPSKNLDRIFKYDAIIVGHGDEDKDSDVSTAKGITDNSTIENSLKSSLTYLDKCKELSYDIDDLDPPYDNLAKNYLKEVDQVIENINNLLSYVNEDSAKEAKTTGSLYALCSNAYKQTSNLIFKYKFVIDQNMLNAIKSAKANIKKAVNFIKAKNDPKQAIKDGKASNWTVQPVNTLKASGLDTIVDILRQLKKEGFKNVFVGACNPGSITLPKDIIADKSFKVTAGTANVYLENDFINSEEYKSIHEMELMVQEMFDTYGRDYENMSLTELYSESSMILNEGVGSALLGAVKKIGQIIASIWNKVVGFIKEVVSTIYSKIRSKFDKNYKLKKPAKATVIEMKDGKPISKEIGIVNSSDIMKEFNSCINSIKNAINKNEQQEKTYMSKIEKDIAAGKFSKHANGKIVDANVKESAIFTNIQFI